MSAKFERIVKSLSNTIKAANKKKTSPYDTTATVKRVEGKTAYVHIPGGVDETPVEMTINAAPGDSVQVRVGGGKAWLVGNGSAPPTDDTRANQSYVKATEADEKAIIAGNAAESAQRSAEIAHTAAVNAQNSANEAKASAYNANEYATRSLASLSTVQSVAETLTWITQHGTMTLTTDTEVNPAHIYFVLDAGGDYVVGNTHYSLVIEPTDDDISTYYELTIDESLNNYVGTHLAVTGEGLWLLPAGQASYKVLIATGAGTTYTTAGTYIINDTGGQVASFRADGVTIGELLSGQVRIELSTGGMQIIRNSSGTDIVIANIGYGETAGQSGTSYAPYFTFGERKKPSNAYSSTTTYSLGDLVTYNNKEYVYVNANPDSGHAPSAGSAYWKLTVGNYSLAEGFDSVSAGFASHAEGQGIALGNWSHSEGYDSISAGINAHSEGYGTVAQGSGAHSEGVSTFAQGAGSHSEGSLTYAFHDYSHASGYRTKTSRNNQTVIGEWNADDSDALFIVGNGTDNSNRSNAFVAKKNGILYAYGDASTEASIRAEQGSGVIYLYAQVASNGNKGIYGFNSSNQGKEVLRLNSNNEVSLYGSATSVSDLKKKDIIDDFDWKAEDFIRGLKPIAYRMKYQDGTKGKRIHMGFGAQDVKALSDELSMGDLSVYKAQLLQEDEEGRILEVDYDGHEVADEKLSWGLDYAELIPMLTKEIQRLMTRVDELERRLDGESKE